MWDMNGFILAPPGTMSQPMALWSASQKEGKTLLLLTAGVVSYSNLSMTDSLTVSSFG